MTASFHFFRSYFLFAGLTCLATISCRKEEGTEARTTHLPNANSDSGPSTTGDRGTVSSTQIGYGDESSSTLSQLQRLDSASDDNKDGSSIAGGSQMIGGSILNLAIVPSAPSVVTPLTLVRTLAAEFNVSPYWDPPRFCDSVPTTFAKCANLAEKPYCDFVVFRLTQLYCDLGGESRDQASYIGASITSGDLLLLWNTALNICSFQDVTATAPGGYLSVTAARLGVSYNQLKRDVAYRLVTKFLGYNSADARAATEVSIIMNSVFMPSANAGGNRFDGSTDVGMKELLVKFSQACSYLVMHERQLIY